MVEVVEAGKAGVAQVVLEYVTVVCVMMNLKPDIELWAKLLVCPCPRPAYFAPQAMR
jgi:hypothetical protein